MSETRLIIVLGKGGVGRSTVSAALAAEAASAGKSVLVFDGTNDGGLARSFEGSPPTGVEILGLSTEAALAEYLDQHLTIRIPGLRVGPIAKAFDFLAIAAPGVREILAMGKVCEEVRQKNYDLVILDAPATGHAIELLASQDTLADLIPVGPLTKQTAWMRKMLADDSTKAIMVSLAEEVPISESIELGERLRDETSVGLSGIVVNRYGGQLSRAARSEAKSLVSLGGPLGEAADLVRSAARSEREALKPLIDSGLAEIVTAEYYADPKERIARLGEIGSGLL